MMDEVSKEYFEKHEEIKTDLGRYKTIQGEQIKIIEKTWKQADNFKEKIDWFRWKKFRMTNHPHWAWINCSFEKWVKESKW